MKDDDDDDVMSGAEYVDKDKSGWESTTVTMPEGVKPFKLDSTKTRYIDIIPYVVGRGNPKADKGQTHYERTYFVHKGMGPEGKGREICQAQTFKKPCVICKLLDKMLSEGDIDKDLHKERGPKRMQLWNVIDVENRDAGIQIFDINNFYFGKPLVTALSSLDSDEPEQFFASYKRGFTLKLSVEENTFKGRSSYKVARVDFKKRKKQYKSSIKEEAYCLDDLIKKRTDKELTQAFLQTSEETDEDDTDKKGKKNMAKKKATAKAAPIVKGSKVKWDEVDGTLVVKRLSKDGKKCTLLDEDDEEHEDVAVKDLVLVVKKATTKTTKKAPVKSKKKSKASVDDDDEEDEEEDEEEEDEEEESDDEEEEDEEEEEEDESDDEEEEESDDEEEEEEDEEEEEESDDDEEEEEESDDEEEEEEDEEEEEEEEDEPAPKKKTAKKKVVKKKSKK